MDSRLVFGSGEYVEIGAEGNDKKPLVARGVSASAYEKQLVWPGFFLSQALELSAGKSKVPPENTRCGGAGRRYSTDKTQTTNAQKGTCMREFYNFNSGKQDDPRGRPACHC